MKKKNPMTSKKARQEIKERSQKKMHDADVFSLTDKELEELDKQLSFDDIWFDPSQNGTT